MTYSHVAYSIAPPQAFGEKAAPYAFLLSSGIKFVAISSIAGLSISVSSSIITLLAVNFAVNRESSIADIGKRTAPAVNLGIFPRRNPS
ncbi:hypothetical protein BDV18DRAFT_4170 [Aspergillus unguis]